MIETEIFSRLRKAIEKLPRECRKVFELCYFEGMNNEKAAQTLRISIETVKAQKKRANRYCEKICKSCTHCSPYYSVCDFGYFFLN